MFVPLAVMAAGQIYGGMAANAEGKASQNLANYNAQVQEREAKAIEARGLIESRRQADEAERQQASVGAQLSASGAVTTSGAPLQILAENSNEAELDNLMIGYNTAVDASRAREQGKADLYGGKLARMQGKNAMTGSFISAAGTVLSGFSSSIGTGKSASNDAMLAAKHGIKY